jgi:hypothetical protein
MDSLRDMLWKIQTARRFVYSGITLNAGDLVLSNRRVNWIKRVMAVVLLALWVPTTSHCQIELVGLLPDFLSCEDACASHGSEEDAEQDSCQSLESATYKMDEKDATFVAAVFFLVAPELLGIIPTAPESSLIPSPTLARAPELPVTWQFSLRTALSPRAPTFAS